MCGGYDGGNYFSSCEINVAGENDWSPMTSLPGTRVGINGLTIDNRVLMIGKIKSSFDFCLIPTLSGGYGGDLDILELDLATEEWRTVGNFYNGRIDPGVSTITEDSWQYCT